MLPKFVNLPVLVAVFSALSWPAAAQVSADYSAGGAVRIGTSTTTCNSSAEGAIRYNTTSDTMEFCNGTAWTSFAQVQSPTGPTAPAGSGYFVMTNTTWDGNLGGVAGADSKCFTELTVTHTNWRGYAAASANGQLTSGKIKAFVCCNNLMPLTTYYFAYANNPTPGGASFTTDASGLGPNDSAIWSAANYFSGSYEYWTRRASGTSTRWPATEYNPGGGGGHCDNWSGNNGSWGGWGGTTGSTSEGRWANGEYPCNTSRRLICFVNP